MDDRITWRTYLEGAPARLALPFARERASDASFRGALRLVDLPVDVLDALARQVGTDSESAWLAALAGFLFRYCAAGDLVIGCPEGAEPGISKVLRIGVNERRSLRQLIADAGAAWGVTDQLGSEHTDRLSALRGTTPLFHAGFFFNADPHTGTPQRWWQHADVTLVVRAVQPSCVEWVVDASVIDPSTADNLARHFATFVRNGLSSPDAPIGELELLGPDERRMIVSDWNATQVELDDASCLPERLKMLALNAPDVVALVEGDEQLTFAELNSDANRVANYLRWLGLAPTQRVALCVERSARSVLLQMGILKAGGAVLFLDPTHPLPRIRALVEAADAKLIVVSAPREGFEALPCGVVSLERDADAIADSPADEPDVVIEPDMPVLAAATSGSTGEAKVVLCRHGALSNACEWARAALRVTSGDRATWLSSPGYGISQLEWWALLANGAAIHVADDERARTPDALRDWLIASGITHTLVMTPMAVRLWPLEWPATTALRVMQIAGERCREWPRADLPFEVLNIYGSAEATLVATCSLKAGVSDAERAGHLPPVGRPVFNVRTYVLDERQKPVPAGVLGELYIAGAGLSLGYTDRALAREKFGPISLPEETSAWVYRTGDLARFWPGGQLEICGRLDTQVKIRGSRVELGEVERVLAGCEGVREVVVTDRDRGAGEAQLFAYIVPKADPPPCAIQLRRKLRETLPAYMVPAGFVFLDALPMLASGKVNRRALPEPSRDRPQLETAYVAARTPLEEALIETWSRHIGVDGIGIDDFFFDLGGDSLTAIAVLTSIHESFQIQIKLLEFAEAPTVRQLARLIETQLAAGLRRTGSARSTSGALRHDAAGRHEPFALSEMQQALWVGRGAAVELGGVGCHAYFEWESDALDLPRFERAWQGVIARHDMLRAVFLPDGRQQVLAEVPPYRVRITDLHDCSQQDIDAGLTALRERMSHQVLPSDVWPLFEIHVALLPGGRARMYFSIDLLILDAWSYFQNLVPDLIALYEDPNARLPAIEIGFRDYIIARTRTLEDSEEFKRSKAYWLERLAQLPPGATLPTVTPKPGEELRFHTRGHVVRRAAWERIREHGKRSGVTPSVIVVAAFAEILRKWGESDRFTINFPLFDRAPLHPHIERVIGDFTNTLLVAVEKSDGTFRERAQAIQKQLFRDLEHRHFGGVRVLRELMRMKGGLVASAPIVVTSLVGQPAPREVTSFGRQVHAISQTPQVLLDFQVREVDGELCFNWDSLDAAFPEGLLDDMFAAYCGVLGQLGEGAAWDTTRFALLPEAQLRARAEVNATAVEVPDVLLHELLAEQARIRPQAAAVITDQRVLGFAELSALANQVAARLRRLGVRPNQLVGIVMDKGWQQYVAAYGILASGAAYLPIDAQLPAARRDYMLAEGEVVYVLTQRALRDRLALPNGITSLCIEDDFASESSVALPSLQKPDDLAYVIYTSGSTGRPKGVMVPHCAVVNLLFDSERRHGVGPSDRTFAISSLQFDLSVFDLFAIARGIATVVPPPSEEPEPALWAQLVREHGVTFWNSVPALVDMLVTHVEGTSARSLPSLRAVVMSGDFIPVSLPDRLRKIARNVQVVGAGGPTETTVWSVSYPIGEVDPNWRSIPYGKPLSNMRHHVLDAQLEAKPTWVAGEIYTSSDISLAKGYWRDAALTAKRFVTLPSGERAHATGDLGRYLPDGNLEILGRADFQVKIHGHRIELGEVEAALAEQPRVRRAVALVLGTGQAKRLIAYAAVEGDPTSFDTEATTIALGARLPAYMVPARLTAVSELPLSANGKVDRRKLLALADLSSAPAQQGYVAPRNALEEVVSSLVEGVIERGDVGIADNFFELGGDSLTATHLAARIEELFDLRVPMGRLYARPTVAQICDDCVRESAAAPLIAEMLIQLPADELARVVAQVAQEQPAA